MDYELRTWSSLRALGEPAYRSLCREDTSPFLSYEWLDALECTGCVSAERGWVPLHLTLHQNDELVAFAPAYLKGNSEGEFVFDHSWARFSEASLGSPYYPKLVVAVPFTPATGSRLLVRPGHDVQTLLPVMAAALRRLTSELGVSSAHVLFPTEAEAGALVSGGLARRLGVQFQWQNAGYTCFDDFLSRFNAKRRHQIRRERREAMAQGVDIEILTGRDLTPAIADFVHAFYAVTVDKFFWGRRYLKREFFEEILARMPDKLHVVAAKDRASGRRIAGAFNVLSGDALYGRYWGSLQEREFLHFEVCFYRGIEDAIARGLSRFEPGAGGEHKLARGFEPTATFSAHHLADSRLDAAIRDFLKREEAAVRLEMAAVSAQTGLKPRC